MSNVTSLTHELTRLRELPRDVALARLEDLELDARRLSDSGVEGMEGEDPAGLLRQIRLTREYLKEHRDPASDGARDDGEIRPASEDAELESGRLAGRRVAFLVADGFEESELLEPMEAVRTHGGHPVIVSPNPDTVRGWKDGDWSDSVEVDACLDEARPLEFDGLVLPGGVMNPDQLRTDESAQSFVRGFFQLGRPVAAICHAPWMLAEVDVIEDRTVTSWPSLKTDLQNAGARWVDEPVVVDGGLVTSRKPADLAAFCAKLVEEFAEGHHRDQKLAAS